MKQVVKVFEKFVKILSLIAMVICMLAAAITVGMVTIDVLRRLIFKTALIGATEYTQLLFIMMVFAVGATTMRGEHTCVDLFTSKMPKVPRVVISILNDLLSLAVCVFVSVGALKLVAFSKISKASYAMIGIPEWPLMMGFGIAFAIAALTFILFLKRDLHKEYPDKIPMPEVISNTSLDQAASLSAEELGEQYLNQANENEGGAAE